MKTTRLLTTVFVLAWLLSACSIPTSPPATSVSPPTLAATLPPTDPPSVVTATTAATSPATAAPGETATSPAPDATATMAATATTSAPAHPAESIAITEPASGSVVMNPVVVRGEADPTFEQNLVVRVLEADGTVISTTATTIQADVGQRGPFNLELPLIAGAERSLFIQVFATSARDGGVTHLSSVGVSFSPTGPANILSNDDPPEQIAIFQPALSQSISGGTVHVEGFALATFEQSLVVEVLDENGSVIGMTPVLVQSSEMGVPGPFSADVPYTLAATGPGRVVVRDISPAHGDNTHLSSVEVNLSP